METDGSDYDVDDAESAGVGAGQRATRETTPKAALQASAKKRQPGSSSVRAKTSAKTGAAASGGAPIASAVSLAVAWQVESHGEADVQHTSAAAPTATTATATTAAATTTHTKPRPDALPAAKRKELVASQLGGATGYFTSVSKKGRTSKLSEEFVAPNTNKELVELLARVPGNHSDEKKRLLAEHDKQFARIWLELCTGFSVMLFGLGSKISVLQRFAKALPRIAAPQQVFICVVNGFDESADVGVLVDDLISSWLGMSSDERSNRRGGKAWQLQDKIELIKRESENQPRLNPLVLVVHSIDVMHRSGASEALSFLADCPKIHLLASTDHVASGLLWTQRELDRFDFVWHDASTFAPYALETHHFASASVQGGHGARAARGASYVLKSLTPHHLSILKEMGRRQLEPDGKDGIEVRVLLEFCLHSMLFNNPKMLDSFLAEFIDHELVVRKKASDGTERLVINMDKTAIQREIMRFGEDDA